MTTQKIFAQLAELAVAVKDCRTRKNDDSINTQARAGFVTVGRISKEGKKTVFTAISDPMSVAQCIAYVKAM